MGSTWVGRCGRWASGRAAGGLPVSGGRGRAGTDPQPAPCRPRGRDDLVPPPSPRRESHRLPRPVRPGRERPSRYRLMAQSTPSVASTPARGAGARRSAGEAARAPRARGPFSRAGRCWASVLAVRSPHRAWRAALRCRMVPRWRRAAYALDSREATASTPNVRARSSAQVWSSTPPFVLAGQIGCERIPRWLRDAWMKPVRSIRLSNRQYRGEPSSGGLWPSGNS
jgi:hypothetical protein